MREGAQRKAVRAVCGAMLLALAASIVHASPAELTRWRSGLTEIDEGWAAHDGDDPAWARPEFDAGAWKTVDLDDMGPAEPGWHWYRKHISVGFDQNDVRLLVEGGLGAYELYVNGARVPGANFNSQLNVYRPVERVFALHDDRGDYTITLRTHAPANYVDYKLPLFLSVTLGRPTAIEYERAALQAERLNDVWGAIFINLLLCAAGIATLGFYLGQRGRREYLFLGLYLFVLGLANGLWNLQLTGVAPTSVNFLGSDLLVYVFTILQIEFTYSFVGKRPGRAMRIYQCVLLLPWILAALCWMNRFSSGTYALIEAGVTLPAGFALTGVLLVLYRRGNREAGWLILPSLLPLTAAALFDLGSTSIVLGWQRFDFLDSLVPVGVLRIQPQDLADLIYLLAICVVMFYRFARVSHEQALASAELEAAREVQQRLVRPARSTPGFKIESAYIPAKQVGGDFYQARACDDGSVMVIVGDVSGKGLPAAMGVSAIMGALIAMPELEPAHVLAGLNRGIYGNTNGGFVTCCALRVTRDGAMTLANAGHLQPYRNGREVETSYGLPLGVIEDTEYEEVRLQLEPGDRLTLLSDGVVEARSGSGELFGFERTEAISTQAAEEIARTAQAFGQEDDITVLTLVRQPLATTSTGTVAASIPALS
jgi:phosphoserine phosphatase RsbU/P